MDAPIADRVRSGDRRRYRSTEAARLPITGCTVRGMKLVEMGRGPGYTVARIVGLDVLCPVGEVSNGEGPYNRLLIDGEIRLQKIALEDGVQQVDFRFRLMVRPFSVRRCFSGQGRPSSAATFGRAAAPACDRPP